MANADAVEVELEQKNPTDPPKQQSPSNQYEIGQFIKLKNVTTSEIILYEIQPITSSIHEETEIMNRYTKNAVIELSTNRWLFNTEKTSTTGTDNIADEMQSNEAEQGNRCTNSMIAILVIIIQIISYFTIAYYLMSIHKAEVAEREENCYGPNCKDKQPQCLHITTGFVTGVLIIGFLWADIINTSSMIRQKGQFIGSVLIAFELIFAMISGILVGINSSSEFDAINGAVGILFVHDLDEKIYAAMVLIRSNKKKIFAFILWIVLSIIIAVSCACKYSDGFYFGGDGKCKQGEFKCGDGECIWSGFTCNGAQDCKTGEDENSGCNFALITCPSDTFMCQSTGNCITDTKQCDGVIDCKDGSDELFNPVYNGMAGDDKFRCITSGICIDMSKQCDNTVDCEDGSDEIFNPAWNSGDKFKCETSEVCIDIDKRCNGVLDCDDGSDEATNQNCDASIANITCPSGQPFFEKKYNDYRTWIWKISQPSQFKCANGQCIDAQAMCDGKAGDCIDGSDEYPYFNSLNKWPFMPECPYWRLIECGDGEILCKASGQCINTVRICDGTADCPNGEDEIGCPAIYTPHYDNEICYGSNGFQCGGDVAFINESTFILFDGQALPYTTGFALGQYVAKGAGPCIPTEWRCDGIVDCANGRDEEQCYRYECGLDEWQCDDGQCIPQTWFCDLNTDCKDASDEFGCPNAGSVNIACGDFLEGSITFDNWRSSIYTINIDATYQDVQFTTCTNSTVELNTFINVHEINGDSWYNDDADECDVNSGASIITLNSNDLVYGFPTELQVYVDAKYRREAFGDFGLKVVCTKKN